MCQLKSMQMWQEKYGNVARILCKCVKKNRAVT